MDKQRKGFIVDKRTDKSQVICEKCPGFTYDILIVDEVDGQAVGPYMELTCIECGYVAVDHT
jgi:hypothetical protein